MLRGGGILPNTLWVPHGAPENVGHDLLERDYPGKTSSFVGHYLSERDYPGETSNGQAA